MRSNDAITRPLWSFACVLQFLEADLVDGCVRHRRGYATVKIQLADAVNGKTWESGLIPSQLISSRQLHKVPYCGIICFQVFDSFG
jgi:hypothetical protein